MDAENSIEDLYERFMPGAVRLAFLVCNNRAGADDIAQDAFLKVASRLRSIRDQTRFEGYLRRTVIRTAIDAARSENRRTARSERAIRLQPRPGETDADAGSHRADLVAALAELSTQQRAAVVLRYWIDMSDADIAAALGCPLGTVKSMLSRSLDSLRKRMPTDV